MPLPRSIVLPAGLAILTAVVIGGVLVWQLDRTRALLTGGINVNEPTTDVRPIAAVPAATAYGDSALGALRRGDLLALRGEWTQAEAEFRAAVDAGGGLTALRKLAQAQLQRRDLDGARDTLRRLKAAGARDEDLLLLESVIHLRSGELEDARALLQRADESPQKQYGLSLLAIVEERHDDARTALSAVLAGWEPTLRGYAKTLLGAYEEYDLFDGSPETHRAVLLGRALADVGECELALPLLGRALATKDDYRDAWTVQGFCQLTTERTADAKASLERAYQIDPQKPEIQYFLARTLSKLGEHAGAITYLQYAIQNGFEPVAEARRLLAAEALASGDTALALQELDLLTRADDATVEAFADFVTAAINADKREEAYARAQEAVSRFPDNAAARELLRTAALATGRKDPEPAL